MHVALYQPWPVSTWFGDLSAFFDTNTHLIKPDEQQRIEKALTETGRYDAPAYSPGSLIVGFTLTRIRDDLYTEQMLRNGTGCYRSEDTVIWASTSDDWWVNNIPLYATRQRGERPNDPNAYIAGFKKPFQSIDWC